MTSEVLVFRKDTVKDLWGHTWTVWHWVPKEETE